MSEHCSTKLYRGLLVFAQQHTGGFRGRRYWAVNAPSPELLGCVIWSDCGMAISVPTPSHRCSGKALMKPPYSGYTLSSYLCLDVFSNSILHEVLLEVTIFVSESLLTNHCCLIKLISYNTLLNSLHLSGGLVVRCHGLFGTVG